MKKNYFLKCAILIVLLNLSSTFLWAIDETVPVGGNIQTAIDNVATSGGGTVTLAAGIHTINRSIKMKSNVTLQGEGNWGTLIKTTRNMKMIIADSEGLVNVTIKNLELEGTNASSGGGIEITAGDDYPHDNLQILNVHCYNTGWGVHVKGTKNLLVKDCLFEKNGTVGKEGFAHNMYLRRVYGAEVRDSQFLNSISANGINISYSTDIAIYNCEMSGNYFRGVRAAVTVGYTVHDCIVKDNGDVGIFANAEIGITTTEIDIKRNCVSNNTKEGIKALNSATGIVTDNNSYGNSTNYSLPDAVTQSGNITDATMDCTYSFDPYISLVAKTTENSVVLEWAYNKITPVDQDIFRGTEESGSGRVQIAPNVDLTTLTYTDESGVSGTNYYYWVKANDGSNSYNSNAAIGGKVTVYEPSVTLSAESRDSSVALNWDIQDITEKYVDLYRNTEDNYSGSNMVANRLTAVSTYVDNSVVNETEYWYWLKVINDSGTVYKNEPATYALPSASLSVVDYLGDIEEIVMSPNPVSTEVTIKMSQGGFNSYTIYDTSGRVNVLGSISSDVTEKTINVDQLSKGIYFVSLVGNKKQKTLKLIKN
mgnify:CR=1 FL=1